MDKENLPKIEVDGKIYYYQNGVFLDEDFVVISNKNAKIPILYFAQFNYEKMSMQELYDFILEAKSAGGHLIAIEAAKYGLDKYGDEDDFGPYVLPMLMSSCRIAKMPNDAIEYAEKYTKRFNLIANNAFYTSLAAAYCDIKAYDKAKQYANKAFRIEKEKGYLSMELDLLIKRLKNIDKAQNERKENVN